MGPQAAGRTGTPGSSSRTMQMLLDLAEELRAECGPMDRLGLVETMAKNAEATCRSLDEAL